MRGRSDDIFAAVLIHGDGPSSFCLHSIFINFNRTDLLFLGPAAPELLNHYSLTASPVSADSL